MTSPADVFATPTLPDSADVVVVGAGLAGLSAAWELSRAGLDVIVIEASDAPGGRIRTDLVGGFRLDRGFQLINPSYPRVRRLAGQGGLDLRRLDLRPFDPGVRVALAHGDAVLADPRRSPSDVVSTLRAPVGSLAEKIAFAGWALRAATLPVHRLARSPERSYGQTFDRLGINGRLRQGVLDPFLAGVLGEDQAETSSRFAELVIRSFLRGTPAVPASGMQEVPDQLAAALPSGTLFLNTEVEHLAAGVVHTSLGTVRARAVLVATDAGAAARLTGIAKPEMRALTTFWFGADEPPLRRPILSVDGQRRGPIVNAAVLSQVASGYAPPGRALIGCTIVGLPTAGSDLEVARQAGAMFDARTDDWLLLRTDAISDALPAMRPPLQMRKPAKLADRLFIAGDHRDTASQQGALASGARAALAVIADAQIGR